MTDLNKVPGRIVRIRNARGGWSVVRDNDVDEVSSVESDKKVEEGE